MIIPQFKSFEKPLAKKDCNSSALISPIRSISFSTAADSFMTVMSISTVLSIVKNIDIKCVCTTW